MRGGSSCVSIASACAPWASGSHCASSRMLRPMRAALIPALVKACSVRASVTSRKSNQGQAPRHLRRADQLAPHPGADLRCRHLQDAAELGRGEQTLQILHLVGETENLQERGLGDDAQRCVLLLETSRPGHVAAGPSVRPQRPAAMPHHQVGGVYPRLTHHPAAGSRYPSPRLLPGHRRQPPRERNFRSRSRPPRSGDVHHRHAAPSRTRPRTPAHALPRRWSVPRRRRRRTGPAPPSTPGPTGAEPTDRQAAATAAPCCDGAAAGR